MTGSLFNGSYRLIPAHLSRCIGEELPVTEAIHSCTGTCVTPPDEPLHLRQPTSSKHSICTCRNPCIEISALPCQTHTDIREQWLLALMTIAVHREGFAVPISMYL